MRLSLLLCSILLVMSSAGWAASEKSVADLSTRAIGQSQVTLPGSKPFHLKAHVIEVTNPENHSYDAEIEEYWFAPDKWRRTVKAEGFSSLLIVNGNKRSEQITGDYYSNWLRTLVTAILEPGAPLREVDMAAPSDNPVIGGKLFCRRFESRVGVAPAENRIFSSVCFDGGRLQSVGLPGYRAEYNDYESFADKKVARRIREYIEPGTELEATITSLTELHSSDESMFVVAQSTSALQTITVTEETIRKLGNDDLDIQWPPIQGGKTEGVLSVYVCIDRSGKVRESYALNSDHPDMSDAAQKQLAEAHFKQSLVNGESVQVEGILTFAYKTTIHAPYSGLTPGQIRQLASEESQAQAARKQEQAKEERNLVQETQSRRYWTNPSTGLTWAGKDNGKRVSWHKAMKYCRKLRLAGYSDWRLATIDELESLVNLSAYATEYVGSSDILHRNADLQVSGGLLLTDGRQWSSTPVIEANGHPSGAHFWSFWFDEGRRWKGFEDWAEGDTMNALCVRDTNARTSK